METDYYLKVPRCSSASYRPTPASITSRTCYRNTGDWSKQPFILRYLHSQALRRRIHGQLNKGEQLHALLSWLWFGGGGVLRHKQEEAQQKVVRCLNVVTNVVVVWNTVYAQLALQR